MGKFLKTAKDNIKKAQQQAIRIFEQQYQPVDTTSQQKEKSGTSKRTQPQNQHVIGKNKSSISPTKRTTTTDRKSVV